VVGSKAEWVVDVENDRIGLLEKLGFGDFEAGIEGL